MKAPIESPPIRFCEWLPWRDRSAHRQKDGPWLGVYLWAHFHEQPPRGKAYPDLPQQLIYVGETKVLDTRPLVGKQHHRLRHYIETFPADADFGLLYFSLCRIRSFPDGYRSPHAVSIYDALRVYTQYVEAQIYWEYTQRWGHPPALHYKRSNKRGNRRLKGSTDFVGPGCTCGAA
jgi:hypothetical protein